MYEGATLITSAEMTRYREIPWKLAAGVSYPSRHLVLKYLRDCATDTGIMDRIIFNKKVLGIEYVVASNRWNVKTSDGESTDFDGVVLACGCQWIQQKIPAFDYANPHVVCANEISDPLKTFEGRSVAIVGGGNTAADLARMAAEVATDVTLYLGVGRWLIPKYVDDLPSDYPSTNPAPKGSRGAWLQSDLQRLLKGIHPSLDGRGWPEPNHLPLTRALIIGDEILESVSSGSIQVIAGSGHGVLDESRDTLIVIAAGYMELISIASQDGVPLTWRSFVLNVFHNTFHSLFAVRPPRSDIGGFWPMEMLGKLVARSAEMCSSSPDRWKSARSAILGSEWDLQEGGQFSLLPDASDFVLGSAYIDAVARVGSILGLAPSDFAPPNPVEPVA